ncbi:formate dehydrogenase subunit gamma [Aureimonas flava]|uniref:Formate dehydrogenase subunit gamma n=1 Tax=Aureimonas flava TaxID=2320271 RepID=A0A3A1WMQ2_9HYPH|nr:formate dehydrogenase subunit gamma [Aureimonas flava]RIY02836.1 formate dehydrogenase subunit gamma [Aureimonas flava]
MLDSARRSTPFDRERLDEIIETHRGRAGALLPILHDVQGEFGMVDDDAVPVIAAALNLSRADVHGVLTFYHDFRRRPAGRTVVKVCAAEACQAAGGRALQAAAERLLGVPMKGTTGDGAATLEPVYCLGLCSVAPAAMVDGRVHGRLTAERLETIVEEAMR